MLDAIDRVLEVGVSRNASCPVGEDYEYKDYSGYHQTRRHQSHHPRQTSAAIPASSLSATASPAFPSGDIAAPRYATRLRHGKQPSHLYCLQLLPGGTFRHRRAKQLSYHFIVMADTVPSSPFFPNVVDLNMGEVRTNAHKRHELAASELLLTKTLALVEHSAPPTAHDADIRLDDLRQCGLALHATSVCPAFTRLLCSTLIWTGWPFQLSYPTQHRRLGEAPECLHG